MYDLVQWQPEIVEILPKNVKTPAEITTYAAQLSIKDRRQIVAAFGAGHFDMAVTYLWGKTLNALNKELGTVGVGLLGEMLGKSNVDEDDDVSSILTAKDSIRLAEELGIVSSTDGIRLRHTFELVTHFSQLEVPESDSDEINENEAIASLIGCVKGILGRPKVEVARRFVDFRAALEGESIKDDDHQIEMLAGSPYFFKKLTISVLLNGAKKNVGASLDHTLANLNVIVPVLWGSLRDSEKWQIGYAYAETFAEGKTTVLSGLKSVLLKVKGFDFVPENLRSDTFVKAAEAIIQAHEGMNNFYNEPAPVKNLARLGTTIPAPALPACISALLAVSLGNYYGVSWTAASEASAILDKISDDRWMYYLNNVLPSDIRILEKFTYPKPINNWINLVGKYQFNLSLIKNKNISILLDSAIKRDSDKITKISEKLSREYYGRKR